MSAHITIDDNTRLASTVTMRMPGFRANGHHASSNTPFCGDTLAVARTMTRHDTAPRNSMTLWNAPGVRDAGPTMTVEQYLASIAR